MPPISATDAVRTAATGRPRAAATSSGYTSVNTGSGWLITAPACEASMTTVAPGDVCVQRPGPSAHAEPSEGWPANGSSPCVVQMRTA